MLKFKDLQGIIFSDYELVNYETGEKLAKAPLSCKWSETQVVYIKPKQRTTNYLNSIMVDTYLEIQLLVEGN